ncbi:acetylornithine deacetylase [Fontibacillus solani]|uniref:Acetylornithine deacetylase n=1 Tax=Fontibacillus solani TaxID=1572857 RepID=A0A7W3SST8_9BACL|nr:hypothetical protein [Fontibacillus solani]MBA9085522.1 acetylornithine deacetylase [Fontibacillus solani]
MLLGFLAQYLVDELSQRIEDDHGKMCLAGLYTGQMHNKVFGSGQCHINFAYSSTESGERIRCWVEEVFSTALHSFTAKYASIGIAALTAQEAKKICKLTWVKQGLPVLQNRHAELEPFLHQLGMVRNPDELQEQAFTCDAMWAQRRDVYSIVYGPGSLAEHLAHADGEYVHLSDLEQYAGSICKLLQAYASVLRNKRVKELNR